MGVYLTLPRALADGQTARQSMGGDIMHPMVDEGCVMHGDLLIDGDDVQPADQGPETGAACLRGVVVRVGLLCWFRWGRPAMGDGAPSSVWDSRGAGAHAASGRPACMPDPGGAAARLSAAQRSAAQPERVGGQAGVTCRRGWGRARPPARRNRPHHRHGQRR